MMTQLPSSQSLPIDAVLPELLASLEHCSKAVLVAAPGAGKTTRVPLALLSAPWRGDGKIIMLEPRRLAARAAARRMAQTLGESVGETIGFRVRLESQISSRTRVEVVTEGVFARMIMDDPELTGVASVVFDEFHERSLDGDLGLALALDAATLREDLRIIVMSATLDGARISKLMDDAPVIESAGRAFPVETNYLSRDPSARMEDDIAGHIRRIMGSTQGSALVFLPGQGEIRRVAERIEGRLSAEIDIAPLYGALTPQEQDRAIQPAPPGRRKLVLATSIAETSLTIEGVRIVIDAGLARVPRYEPATGLTRLETVRVSRAAADQRRGRAGRTEPGICFRLWDEGQTAALEAFDRPEILEADLSSLVLDLAAWGVSDPSALTFLDPPPKPAWTEAVELLKALDALDSDGRLTQAGRKLAQLPLHPRLAHMVMEGAAQGDGQTAAEIAMIVSEHGLGGDAVDLSARLDRFRTDRTPRGNDARQLARRLAKTAGGPRVGDELSPGQHLARAYPDRIAQARGARGAFRLANGRGGSVEEYDSLAKSPFLVVADLTGQAASSRIRLAASFEKQDLLDGFASHIVREDRLYFDKSAKAVRARRVTAYMALTLSEEPVAPRDPAAAAKALAEGMAEVGLDQLPWSKEQKTLRNRATYLHQSLGGDWPDLSADALKESVGMWLAPALHGKAALSEVSADDLGQALDTLLPWSKRQEIDRLLPSHFEAPTGNRLPIDYAAENGPALEIRVQELFGLNQHPSVGGGRIPLLLVLLSPAHRPIQTTRDLPGFWRGSWADVAKDLKGRYPRHPWPEDPLVAQATARAKPRGT